MNKIKFLPLLLTIIYVNSQQLDENYLDSTGWYKKDLLERADKNGEVLKKIIDHLYSSKLEQAEDLMI